MVVLIVTSSCRAGPTECKLRLTVLLKDYTKSHRKQRSCKKGHRVKRYHLHVVGIVLVNRHPMGGPLCCRTSRHKQVPLLGSCQSWDLCICLEYCTVWLIWCSVTHLLGNLMRVKDTRDRHLDFVFLLLGLTERRLPLLQKQV